MRLPRTAAVLLSFAAMACGPEGASPSHGVVPSRLRRPDSGVLEPLRCPVTLDPADLFARHAASFGRVDAIASAFPVTFHGHVDIEGQRGAYAIALSANAHRARSDVAGAVAESGIDRSGAWTLGAGSGLVERLRDDEAVDVVFDAWLMRRSYLRGFETGRDSVACQDDAGGGHVDVSYSLPAVGSPRLAFDLTTASLLSVRHTRADGRLHVTTIDSWAPPDARGIRWPKKTTSHLAIGSPTSTTYDPPDAGLACDGARGEACLDPPLDRVRITWPASPVNGANAAIVRVPFQFVNRQLVVRARIGAREVHALVDSGASMSVVDATMPAGEAFRSRLELAGANSTQKIRAGIGELPLVSLGGLELATLPTARVPIPALEGFGDKRPELIVGYTLFASAVVRIDYKKREIVFAKRGVSLAGKEARSTPLRVANGKLLARAKIEGLEVAVEVDTGSSGALDLTKKFADAHGLPGTRPVVVVTGRFGAGAEETTSRVYRVSHMSLGPIVLERALVHEADPPDMGIVSGLAGNALFARCDAIVIDTAARTLWLEGTCDRDVPEPKMGWRLARKPDAAFANRPWVVQSVAEGGSAERAGIRRGDRVLEVSGKPAGDDVTVLESVETQAAGTKVPVVVAREGRRERVVVELSPVVPRW